MSALDQHRGGRLSCHFRWLRGRCETEGVKDLMKSIRPTLSGSSPNERVERRAGNRSRVPQVGISFAEVPFVESLDIRSCGG